MMYLAVIRLGFEVFVVSFECNPGILSKVDILYICGSSGHVFYHLQGTGLQRISRFRSLTSEGSFSLV